MITDFLLTPWTPVVLLLLYYIVPYLARSHYLDIPGPFLAKFSNFWLLYQARRGRRYQTVHELHKKHGKFVRIQPNHVSVADDNAVQEIYGHGNGFLKAYVLILSVHFVNNTDIDCQQRVLR